MREYTGRGPMKARTTIRDNVVLVMLEQTLTKGEQVLVSKGRGENVLALRHEYQEAMREESSAKIAELTGRDVTAMMSANHLAPDLAAGSTSSMEHPSIVSVARRGPQPPSRQPSRAEVTAHVHQGDRCRIGRDRLSGSVAWCWMRASMLVAGIGLAK